MKFISDRVILKRFHLCKFAVICMYNEVGMIELCCWVQERFQDT